MPTGDVISGSCDLHRRFVIYADIPSDRVLIGELVAPLSWQKSLRLSLRYFVSSERQMLACRRLMAEKFSPAAARHECRRTLHRNIV